MSYCFLTIIQISICNSVLDAISELYNNESYAKEKHMTDYERLLYYKEYSQPIMDNLKQFMLEHIASNTVEPNSSLGKAFNYWLKRWDSMTRYRIQKNNLSRYWGSTEIFKHLGSPAT